MNSVYRLHAIGLSSHASVPHHPPNFANNADQALGEPLTHYLTPEAAACLAEGELRDYAQVAETVFREMAFTLALPRDCDNDKVKRKIRRGYHEAAADYLARRAGGPHAPVRQAPPRHGLRRNDAALDLLQLCLQRMKKDPGQVMPDPARSPLFRKDLYLTYFYSVLYQELDAMGIDWNDETTQGQVALLSALLREGLYEREALKASDISPAYDYTGMHDIAALRAAYAPLARMLGIEPSQCPEFGLRLTVEKNIVDAVEQEWKFPGDNPLLVFMFDVEKHYARGMAKGWEAAAQLVAWLRAGGRLCAEQLETLHGTCLKEVVHDTGKIKPIGMGNSRVTYTLMAGQGLTREGAREWLATVKKLNRLCAEAIVELKLPPADGPLVSLDLSGESWESGMVWADMTRHAIYPPQHADAQKAVVKRVADKLIDEFHAAMRAADALPPEAPATRVRRYLAIAALCQSLERLHPFSDGNGRMFEFLLPNVLLLTCGFEAYAPVRPYRIDGASCKEVLEEFREGQEVMRALRARAPCKD